MSTNQVEQLIADEFGVNADYVSELLSQFERDRSSVDEDWRSLFDELLENGRVVTEPEAVKPRSLNTTDERTQTSSGAAAGMIHATYDWGRQAVVAPAPKREAETQEPEPTAPAQRAPAEAEATERIPIRGPALRIAENMEASLAVPTATSQRQVPLKLMDENRRLINQHLAASGRKVSYTHVIVRAILKALKQFPQLNDSFEQADGAAYRVRRADVNLGVAVDVTKKDGTRTLLVPNIKAADKLTFPGLLDAYDDVGLSRHDDQPHQSRNDRHDRLESAADGRSELDRRDRRDRLSARVPGNVARRPVAHRHKQGDDYH